MDFNQNYFEIFGLPVEFDVDVVSLADQYRELQKSVHPDKFVDRTDTEKRLSMQWATLVNSAYTTLKEPLPRALYMLELSDVNVAENPVLSPDFLIEQIDLREQLEEIGDDPSGIDQLEEFKARVTKVTSKLETEFVAAIKDNLDAAEEVVYKMQFMNKLLHDADHLEEKLLDY